MTKTAAPKPDTTKTGKSNVRPFRVDPTLETLGAIDRSAFDDAVEHDRAVNAALAEARAERTALAASFDDPDSASKSVELDARIRFLEESVEAATKAGKKARSLLDTSCAAAYRSPEAIAHATAIGETELDGTKAAEIAEAMHEVRQTLLAVGEDRRFRRKVLGAQHAALNGKTVTSEWSPGGLDSTIEAALSTIETALSAYPGANLVRSAIVKQDRWNEVAGIELDPAAYPAPVRDQICAGLDIQTSRRWINGTTSTTAPTAPKSGGF